MSKYIKIKTGEVFLDGISHSVFQTAFERTSKKGNTYYEISSPVFVGENIVEKEVVAK